MPKPYAIRITATKVMIDALRRNDGKITKIDNTFVDEMEALRAEVEKLNGEQEKLKADLKTKTEEFNKTTLELGSKISFIKKLIKIYIPKTQWREFGIEDKR